jgi:nitrous oxide reductase accessory protein NosL
MKLKYGAICVIALALLGIAAAVVVAGNDIDEYRSCSQCGMDRKAYGYSRMMITYENNSRVGVCSLHCAVTEMEEHRGSAVKLLQVADRTSRSLVDAEKAFWVVGGNRRGVMTQNPKWAFATQDAAQTFVRSSGGIITSWDAVLLAAREDATPTAHHL